MSDLIIKIGDESLDLKSGEVIAITKQAAKVGDFSRVLADGTNEVTIPLTQHNIETLENAHLLQTESEKPYRRLPATLIQEGYETLQDAFAEIKSSNDNFSLQLIGGNASFFNLIKDLNLRDLDLSEYDHFWTNLNAFTNRNTTAGFIYALFEQSDDVADPTLSTYGANLYAVQTEKLLPCFFVKTLVEKIFEAQNYSFVSDITALDIYNNLVTFKGQDWNRGTDSSYLNVSVLGSGDVDLDSDFITQSLFVPLIYNGSIVNQETIFWDEATLNTDLLDGVSSGGLGMVGSKFSKLSFPDATRVTGTFTFDIENTNTGVPIVLSVRAVHSNTGMASTVETRTYLLADNTTASFSETFEFDVTKSDGDIYFDIGEASCLFFVFATYSGVATPVTMKSGGTSSFTFEFISAYDVTTTVPYNFLPGFTPVPDMLQGDFLKDLSRIFQLIYDVDEVTHTVTARRFDEIKENIPNAIDFSDKLHNDKIDIQYQIAGYAQTNYLKWKPDDITKYTGQGIITVDDQKLEAEKTIVEMGQFAASSPVTRFDTKQVPYVHLFTEGLPTNGMTDRMLLVRRETFAYNINFNRSTETPTDYPTDDVTFAYFAEAGNTDSLDFPTLADRFYQAINDMLFRAKTINCFVNLKIKDVVNYNPFIPVYIQKFNNYFYWEKLENYVKNKLTKIKLIKL